MTDARQKWQEEAEHRMDELRENKKRRVLFVINTLGRAGAETALLSLLQEKNPEYEVSLYVLMGQGELMKEVPEWVRICNPSYSCTPVLEAKGRVRMAGTVFLSLFANGRVREKLRDLIAIRRSQKRFQPDKLFWRTVSDGALRMEETFDLAIAFLEGGATYYVADHVRAKRKAAFVHIDYESSGYTREMDRDCYQKMDHIFAVSDETRTHFLHCYPECRKKTMVFPNLLSREKIQKRAMEPGGFSDSFDGLRILTVGRLTYQKGYDIAIHAMEIIKKRQKASSIGSTKETVRETGKGSGCPMRWYVLGEGDQRKSLEREIARLGLREDFVLLGAVENPYPYYAQTDLYVHATRYEGKSIALQEAQILGCPIIASDCNGNREQIQNGKDGILCELTPEALADAILKLAGDPGLCHALGEHVRCKYTETGEGLDCLWETMKE